MAKPVGNSIMIQANAEVIKPVGSPPGANAIVTMVNQQGERLFFQRDNSWNFTEVPSKKTADGKGYELPDGTVIGRTNGSLTVNGKQAFNSKLYFEEAQKLGRGDYTAAPPYEPPKVTVPAPAPAAAAPAAPAAASAEPAVVLTHDATAGEKRITPGQDAPRFPAAAAAAPAAAEPDEPEGPARPTTGSLENGRMPASAAPAAAVAESTVAHVTVGGKPMAPDTITTEVMSRSPNERPQTMTISVAEPAPAPPPPEVEPAPAVDLSTATKRGIENVRPAAAAPAEPEVTVGGKPTAPDTITSMAMTRGINERPQPTTISVAEPAAVPPPPEVEPAPAVDLSTATKRGIENVRPAAAAPATLTTAQANTFAENATVPNMMQALYRPVPMSATPVVAAAAPAAAPPPPPAAEAPKPSKAEEIMKMSKEDRVKAVQQMLSDIGIKDHMKSKYKNGGIDGIAGTDTNRSVTLFQTRMGMTPSGATNGDIDAKTVAALVERHEMTMGNRPATPARPTAGFNTVAAQPADFGAVEPGGPDPAANDPEIRRRPGLNSMRTGMSA